MAARINNGGAGSDNNGCIDDAASLSSGDIYIDDDGEDGGGEEGGGEEKLLVAAAMYGKRLMEQLEERENENERLMKRMDSYRRRLRALEIENLKLSASAQEIDDESGRAEKARTSSYASSMPTPVKTPAKSPSKRFASPEARSPLRDIGSSESYSSAGSSARQSSSRRRRRLSHQDSIKRFQRFKTRMEKNGMTLSPSPSRSASNRSPLSAETRPSARRARTTSDITGTSPSGATSPSSRSLVFQLRRDFQDAKRELNSHRKTATSAMEERIQTERMMKNVMKENEDLAREVEELRAIVKDQREMLRSLRAGSLSNVDKEKSSLEMEILQGEVSRLKTLNKSLSKSLDETRQRGWTWYEKEFKNEIEDVKNKVGSSRRFLHDSPTRSARSLSNVMERIESASISEEKAHEEKAPVVESHDDAASSAAVAVAATPPSVHLETFLFVKSAGMIKTKWMARFFMFNGARTFKFFSDRPRQSKLYRSDNTAGKPLGAIALDDTEVRVVHTSQDASLDHRNVSIRHEFHVWHPVRRTYMLSASTEREMETWVEALQNCMTSVPCRPRRYAAGYLWLHRNPKGDYDRTNLEKVLLSSSSSWTRYFTVMHDDELKCYVRPTDTTPAASVPLDGIQPLGVEYAFATNGDEGEGGDGRKSNLSGKKRVLKRVGSSAYHRKDAMNPQNIFRATHSVRPDSYFYCEDWRDSEWWCRTLRAFLSGAVSWGSVVGLRQGGTFACRDF